MHHRCNQQTWRKNVFNFHHRQGFFNGFMFNGKFSEIGKIITNKSSFVFVSLLLLSYTQDTQALSVQTSNTIEGSAPYLTFDGGLTKVTDIESLLYFTLQDGTTYTPSTNTSTPTNPITLVNGRTFNDIDMVIPTSQSSINIGDWVTQGNWGDDDGDGQGVNGVVATGSISVIITDKNGDEVSRNDGLNICNSPYRVRLVSSGGTLETQYGNPKSSTFNGATVDYYIKPHKDIAICSVRPNLLFGGTGARIYTPFDPIHDDSRYKGPARVWSTDKGFLTVFTDSSSYNRNFPTTGADGMYFDLDISGLDASQLTWSVVTSGDITATVSWMRPRLDSRQDPWENTIQHDNWISDKSRNVTRVTLNGPRADTPQVKSNTPRRLKAPSLPQKFELVGRDRNGNEVRYGFVLKQWFVHRGVYRDHFETQIAWCNYLGYRTPKASDLTNAVRRDGYPVGAAPLSIGNHYQRRIGSGFFTEWGSISNYADADFINLSYWTSETTGINQYEVDSNNGTIRSFGASAIRYGLCVTP